MVAPGWIPVERHANCEQELLDRYRSNVPAGRIGTPQDVASSVVYLASEEARFVTGQTVSVNGGNTMFNKSVAETGQHVKSL